MALSHRSKHNGQWHGVTDGFFRCTAWRSVAENASRTLKQEGMRIIAGKFVHRTWQDESGNIWQQASDVEIQAPTWDRISSSSPPRWSSPSTEGLGSSPDGPPAASGEEKQT